MLGAGKSFDTCLQMATYVDYFCCQMQHSYLCANSYLVQSPMKKLCIGNWKMNCSRETIAGFDASRADRYNRVEIGIALPYVYICMGSKKFGKQMTLCAQDCSQFAQGAHTGEVGAYMLQEMGVKYVILGHSERRHILKEPDSVLHSKLRCCLEANLNVVLCVGETLEHRESGKTISVVKSQLSLLSNFRECEKISVAYEPVWAIGTGKHPEIKDVETVVECAEKALKEYGLRPRILYGGSVNKANCTSLARIKGLDGFLVGNASLTTELFDIADVFEY
eukprot:jgi/Antlo1/1134/836